MVSANVVAALGVDLNIVWNLSNHLHAICLANG